MSKQIKNMSASVHERLLNKAKEDRRSFNELLQYFAMDRLLYRRSKSPHAKRMVLKGALMLRVWDANESITEDADYEGVRIRFKGNLGNAVINMQIDVGFGDIVYPGPIDVDLPSMLEFPKAHLLCYSMESAIAEKFQAMIYLGDANSRMKDFFDIYTLSRQFNFDGDTLAEAIRLTFNNRGTEIPLEVNSFRK